MVADHRDLYVQAAKGIINGMIEHQKERNQNLELQLIDDNFKKKDMFRLTL